MQNIVPRRLPFWVLIRHAGPAYFFRLNTGRRQRKRMCCAVSVSLPGNFLLSVKADHRPVGNSQVATIFAVMLEYMTRSKNSLLVDFAAKQPTIRRVFGHFYGVVPSIAVALFSPLSCPIFASIMCALSIMNRFMTCVIA